MTKKRTLYILGGTLALTTILAAVILSVSAATFDSDVVPDIGGTYGLGAYQGDWSNINATIFFNGYNVGISDTPFTPTSRLHVRGDLRVENGDVYIDSSSYGVILVARENSSCWRLTVDSAGTVAATQVDPCP